MVEYEDGAVIAQLGTPDMKLPIQYALYYPRETVSCREIGLDFWKSYAACTFEKPDMDTFYGLKLAYECRQQTGGIACRPCLMRPMNWQ